MQPSPLARAQAQGAAGWGHLLDQDPAPIKVPTKFRSFNSPLGFEIFDHKIISDCEQMVQFSYSLNMETCAIFPLRLYPQYNASQWLMLDNATINNNNKWSGDLLPSLLNTRPGRVWRIR